MDFESIEKLASETTKTLCQLYDDIGFETSLQQQKLSDLAATVVKFYNSAVSEATEYKKELMAQVETKLSSVESVAEDIGEIFNKIVLTDNASTLLEQIDYLDRNLKRMNDIKQRRTVEKNDLVKVILPLWKSLEVQPKNFPENFTLSTIGLLRQFVEEAKRLENGRRSVIDAASAEIRSLWTLFGKTPDDEFSSFIVSERVPPTESSISELASIKESLRKQRIARQERVEALRKQMAPLRDLLELDQAQVAQWESEHASLSQQCIEQHQEELERLIRIKRERQAELLEAQCDKIRALCKELMMTDEEIGTLLVSVEQAAANAHDEQERFDLLIAAYAGSLEPLENKLKQFKPLMEKVLRREQILSEKAAFEVECKNPARYSQRGLASLLAQEERQRKKYERVIPQLESTLMAALQEWHVEHGVHFMVNGEPYLKTIKEQAGPSAKQKVARRNENQPSAAVTNSSSSASSSSSSSSSTSSASFSASSSTSSSASQSSTSTTSVPVVKKPQRVANNNTTPACTPSKKVVIKKIIKVRKSNPQPLSSIENN